MNHSLPSPTTPTQTETHPSASSIRIAFISFAHLSFLILGLILASPLSASAEDRYCQFPDLGFSFSIPSDWTEVSQANLDKLQRQFQDNPAAQSINCVDAYQPTDHGQDLKYPYLLVEVIKYANNATLAEVSEEELKQMAAKFSGTDITKLVAAEHLGDLAANSTATYQENPPGVQWTNVLKNETVGEVQIWCTCRLGTDKVVQICIYGGSGDAAIMQPAIQTVSKTLYVVSTPSLKTSSLWNGVLGAAVVGGISGIVIYLRKKGDKTPPPESPPLPETPPLPPS
jgi:hypothetical protein